jgi:hypothetical protein
MSPSKKARRSSIPYFSIASRSMPQPKAKALPFVGIEAAIGDHARVHHPEPSTSIQPSEPPITRRPFSIE